MISKTPPALKPLDYEKEARAYLKSLPLEHFMESTAQGTQRKITLESLDLLAVRRPDVRVFNELLVQYPRRGQRRPCKVVPDNMVVVTDEPISAKLSYSLPFEPVRPFWVLEYVSKGNKRKDYRDSRHKYEHQLKVPYYLLFHPAKQQLTLYQHNRRRYLKVKPNEHGRFAIQELDLEVGLHDGWVRYWHRGELLPLPADLQQQLEAALRQAKDTKHEVEVARRLTEDAKRQTEDLRRRLEAAEEELARFRPRQ